MDFPQQVVDWAATAGPATIFGLLWWLERGERRDLQKRYDDMVERALTGLNAAATAVQGLKDLLTAGGRRE